MSVPDIEPSGKLSFDEKKLDGLKPGLIKGDNPPIFFLKYFRDF